MTNPAPSLTPAWQRPIYLVLGCMSLAFGVVALVVPLIPEIVFLALAAACFSRSSPAMDRWLSTHPRFGKLITNWQTSKALSRSTKWVITASMVASFRLIFFETQSHSIQSGVAILMLAVLVYVWRRPEQPSVPAVAQKV
ncbi:YbaN family protein [Variovorax paradoxus]|nr:YbaN family protein [Variovorax paradoxus]